MSKKKTETPKQNMDKTCSCGSQYSNRERCTTAGGNERTTDRQKREMEWERHRSDQEDCFN